MVRDVKSITSTYQVTRVRSEESPILPSSSELNVSANSSRSMPQGVKLPKINLP